MSFPHVTNKFSALSLSSFVALSLMPNKYSVSSPEADEGEGEEF